MNVKRSGRGVIRNYLPSNMHNPVGLVYRLLASGRAEARFALLSALMCIIVSPLALALSIREKKRYREQTAPHLPLVFVCGAPRSSTTLVQQVLIDQLPLAYFNNLASCFPKAPLTAMRLFGRFVPKRPLGYKSYYGKTRYLCGPHDSLYLWDRWVGSDRDNVPKALLPEAETDVRQFFAAAEKLFDRAVINKNNRLITYAHLFSEVLPGATFICVQRDPLMLAQSLLIARREIVGRMDCPYGIDSNDRPRAPDDPLEDVCRQVLFYTNAAKQQQERIGSERFWIIQYEDFCREPASLVRKVAQSALGVRPSAEKLAQLKPFTRSSRVRISQSEFDGLRKRLARLRGQGPCVHWSSQ